MLDTLLTNVQILKEGAWMPGHLGIESARIAEIGTSGSGAARTVVDGKNAYCLPGGVDLHVHFNQPGRSDWEGFLTGTAAAAAGGVTFVSEMPLNSIPSTVSVQTLEAKLGAIAGQAHVDFGLWGGLVPGNCEQVEPLAEAGVLGFKAFMSPSGTADFENADRKTLREGMRRIARTGLRLALHAEDPDVIAAAELRLRQRVSAFDWEAARPVEAELSAVATAIELAGETGCPITIVHVSAPEVVALVQKARAEGLDILCETCPHYLLLSTRDAERIGPAAKCAPPLRSEAVVAGLREALRAGTIDTLGSDHSPCTPDLKAGLDFYSAWGGISGLQHGLPLLFDRLGPEDATWASALQAAFAQRPAAAARLTAKGALRAGAEADFFLLEKLNHPKPIRAEDLLYRNPISAFSGRSCACRVASTWLRGREIARHGKVVSEPGGRFIHFNSKPSNELS